MTNFEIKFHYWIIFANPVWINILKCAIRVTSACVKLSSFQNVSTGQDVTYFFQAHHGTQAFESRIAGMCMSVYVRNVQCPFLPQDYTTRLRRKKRKRRKGKSSECLIDHYCHLMNGILNITIYGIQLQEVKISKCSDCHAAPIGFFFR